MKARMTVVEHVYYQSEEHDPVVGDSAFFRELKSEDQPFARKHKVGQSWSPLSSDGWVLDASMVVLTNELPQYSRNPTKEQKARDEAKVIEVAVYSGEARTMHSGPPILFAVVLPGESLRFQPADLNQIYIRCPNGEVSYSVKLFPN